MSSVGNRRRSSLSSGRSSPYVIPRSKTGFRHLCSGAPAEADEPQVRTTSQARFEQISGPSVERIGYLVSFYYAIMHGVTFPTRSNSRQPCSDRQFGAG
jgi:hypothetical protein